MNVPCHSRPFALGDIAFVVDSWIRSARELPVYRWAPVDGYNSAMRQAIEFWVPKCDITMAVSDDDEFQIIAWLATDNADRTHMPYGYTKHLWRHQGIMTMLLGGLWRTYHKSTVVSASPRFWSKELLTELDTHRMKQHGQ